MDDRLLLRVARVLRARWKNASVSNHLSFEDEESSCPDSSDEELVISALVSKTGGMDGSREGREGMSNLHVHS